MAYSENLASRLRDLFQNPEDFFERKMFGGLAFLHRGNMCFGILGDTLMARVGKDQYESCLSLNHCSEMDFTGRAMKGFVYVDQDGIRTKAQLRKWVGLCMSFTNSLPSKLGTKAPAFLWLWLLYMNQELFYSVIFSERVDFRPRKLYHF